MSDSAQSSASGKANESFIGSLLAALDLMSDKQKSALRDQIDARIPVDFSSGFTDIEDIPCEIPVVPTKQVSVVPSSAAPTVVSESSGSSAPADGPPTKRTKRTFEDYQELRYPRSIFSAAVKSDFQEKSKASNKLRQPSVQPSPPTCDDDLPSLPSSSHAKSGDEDASSSQTGSQWGSDSSQTVPSSPPPTRLSTRSKPSAAVTSSQSPTSSSSPVVQPARGLQASRYASSPAPSLASSPAPSRFQSYQQASSTNVAMNTVPAALDPPQGQYAPITQTPLRSHNGFMSCGKYAGDKYMDRMHQICATRSDYLNFLYHFGTIQLGHIECDLGAVNTVADYEADSVRQGGVGLGRDGARIFPPESFVICYGDTHRGRSMHQLPPKYIRHQITTLKKYWRPWFAEAAAIWQAENDVPPAEEENRAYNNFQQMFGQPNRKNRGRNQSHRRPLGYYPQPKFGGPHNSNHYFGASSSPANRRDEFTSRWSTTHPSTEDIAHVNPDRRPFLLETGQPRLPSSYTVTRREQSSASAATDCMDLTV